MPIEWKPAADYEDQRAQAEQRITARDPDDWAHGCPCAQAPLPVWSPGKDLAPREMAQAIEAAGATVTRNILRAKNRRSMTSCNTTSGTGR